MTSTSSPSSLPARPSSLEDRAVAQALMTNDGVGLKALLAQGMDPYSVRPFGATDLLSCAIAHTTSPDCLRAVLAAKVDPNRMGAPGLSTPWHMAAIKRHTTALKGMVKVCAQLGHAPNVNILNEKGHTPLGLALLHPISVKPKFDTIAPSVQVLLDAGADVNAIDPVSHLPLYLSMWKQNNDVFKSKRVALDPYVMLPAFLKAGMDPNATDRQGNTLLHLMAIMDSLRGPVEQLLQAGANVDRTNNDGKSVWDVLKPDKKAMIVPLVQKRDRALLHEMLADQPAVPSPRRPRL